MVQCVYKFVSMISYRIMEIFSCGNFTKFTTSVRLGTKMNYSDFDAKKVRGHGQHKTKCTFPVRRRTSKIMTRECLLIDLLCCMARGVQLHPAGLHLSSN